MRDWRSLVADFLIEYAWLLDNDKLEEWVQLFEAEGRYKVVPRDNYDRGLSLGLLSCKNRSMIRDRILALRIANEYNIHYDRHIVGPAKIMGQSDESIRIQVNYLVVQTDQGGNSKVFSTGVYHDELVLRDDRLLIRDKLVVVDTFCVPTLIATPL
jgi:3-phenylpropionate/cinnamic acid dioxygenase small subunit